MMRVQPQRRNTLPMLTCGCLGILGICMVVLIAGGIVLLPRLPEIAAQVAGFTPRGDVAAVFVETPLPVPVLENPVTVDQAVIGLGEYGVQSVNRVPTLYEFTIGTSGGAESASITFTEEGLMELCRQRTAICQNQDSRFRNVSLDLRPNGLIAYADVSLPQLGSLTQKLGVVLQVDSTGRRIEFVGLDISGGLFTNPPAELTSLITQIEHDANTILTSLTVEMAGSQYALSRISVTDTMAVVFLQ